MKQKLFFFTIILILFANCRSKKVITEYKEKIIKDTIYTTKTITEVKRFTDTLTIENPCDSLGKLRPFKQSIKIEQGNITLTGINDTITAKIDLKGYKQSIERTYEQKYRDFVSNYKETEKVYVTPWYHWLIHILCVLVIFLLLRLR